MITFGWMSWLRMTARKTDNKSELVLCGEVFIPYN